MVGGGGGGKAQNQCSSFLKISYTTLWITQRMVVLFVQKSAQITEPGAVEEDIYVETFRDE